MLQEKEEIINQAINNFKISYYVICKTFVEIRDQHLFKEKGFDNITSYLDSKPIGIGRRHVLKLMDVYDKFEESAIMALGITKLIEIVIKLNKLITIISQTPKRQTLTMFLYFLA